ncbi:MAG: outer membrane beta-barrel protein [Saprospiraceae bacterium]|nr:outer membrane beta-barrel protein [Saprospiraceae bacterium]
MLVIFLIPWSALSQSDKTSYNYGGFKNKRFYFGLTLGYRNSNYQLRKSQDFVENDSLAVAESISGNGFAVNAIVNMKIGEYFDFRVLPTISFSDRTFEFTYANDDKKIDRIESVFIELPLLVRYKSAPYRDKKVFVTTGVSYTYDVQSNARVRADRLNNIMRLSPHDFSLEFGAGMQFFFPYFIFSPEIKYSHGLENILIYNNNLPRNTALEKVYSRTFSISLHFEG